MNPVFLASLLGIGFAIGGVCLAVVPQLLRKRCPACARRALGFDGQSKVYECGKCRSVYLSANGRTLIPKADWDAGVRTSVPRAIVLERR
ncbi:MAG: hypothetical protein H6Q90_5386 [Deltaproteobacteria bacterium]|nr:hypothetical protein [Deltaproteobacteria bacterium]